MDAATNFRDRIAAFRLVAMRVFCCGEILFVFEENNKVPRAREKFLFSVYVEWARALGVEVGG